MFSISPQVFNALMLEADFSHIISLSGGFFTLEDRLSGGVVGVGLIVLGTPSCVGTSSGSGVNCEVGGGKVGVGGGGRGATTSALVLGGVDSSPNCGGVWGGVAGRWGGGVMLSVGGRWAMSSKIDLRAGDSYMGMNLRKNLLLRRVTLPDPSILMRYW